MPASGQANPTRVEPGADGLIAHRARLCDTWQTHDRGNSNPTFIGGTFTASEWQVFRETIMFPVSLSQTTVVRCEHDQRLVRHTDFVELSEDSPHTGIEAADHRCVNRISMHGIRTHVRK